MTPASHPRPPAAAFSGYRWTNYTSSQGSIRERADAVLASTNWPGLLRYASDLRGRGLPPPRSRRRRRTIGCRFLSDLTTIGLNHLVRVIEFEDGARWVARLPLRPPHDDRPEFEVMCLIREAAAASALPVVPAAHAYEGAGASEVGSAFLLMDCLPGNAAADLGVDIPPEFEDKFIGGVARLHVQLGAVRLPQIGTVLSRNGDGTCRQGPIPGIGGPFDTAADFFRAWADNVRFGLTDAQLREMYEDEEADEQISKLASFRASIKNLAPRLSARDAGPFPLCHRDFGHHNVVVDDGYGALGLIDWESAQALPWEVFAELPLNFRRTPPLMKGAPDEEEEVGHADRAAQRPEGIEARYIAAVLRAEAAEEGADASLSGALRDDPRRQLASAMRMYELGDAGCFAAVVERFAEAHP